MREGCAPQHAQYSGPSQGYAHGSYAYALVDLGEPMRLPRSGGWLLVRPIPGTDLVDGRGCYPLFSCPDWSGLTADIEELGEKLVSVILVTDPLVEADPSMLERSFPDLCRPFKQHYVVDLAAEWRAGIAATHRRNARKAQADVTVEMCEDPPTWLDEWRSLYGSLARRHRIVGEAAFSDASLRRQLEVPGLEMFRAVHRGRTVGMMLYMVQGGAACFHLGAYSEEGYRLRASYALVAGSLSHYESQVRVVNLGSGAGLEDDPEDGLARFKRGWSNSTRTAWICGRVLNRRAYDLLVSKCLFDNDSFFPAYRTRTEMCY